MKSGYCCRGKDCRSFSSKAKGFTVKAHCLHLHLLLASLQQFAAHETSSSAGPSTSPPTPITEENSLQRQSSVLLADKIRKLPYHIPWELLRSIMTRDSCTLFGVSEGAWPELFCPLDENCGLCGSPLGQLINHPGQQSKDTYLITELNAFKKADIKVKTCSNKDCAAIHQPFPADIGTYLSLLCENILSISILLGFSLHVFETLQCWLK